MNKRYKKHKVKESIFLSSRRLNILVIFFLALIVRGIYLYESSDNPTFKIPIVDSQTYDGLARALASGKPMTSDFFWQSIFYPLFLALLYKLSNFSILFVKVFQVFLGTISVVLVYRLGERIFDNAIALLAALIMAVYMPMIFFETELLSVGWATFWILIMMLTLLKIKEKMRMRDVFFFGISGALGTLTRPEILPFFGASGIWLIFTWFREKLNKARLIKEIFSLSFGFLLGISPALILSHQVMNRVRVLPFSGGINFYIGNNPNYKETITIRPGLGWRELTATPTRYGIFDAAGMEKFFQRKTIDYLLSEPLSFLKGLMYKSAQFLNSREIPRNINIYVFRKWSWLLTIFLWKMGKFGFPFGLILPLAFLGIGFYWKKIPSPLWLSLTLYPASVIAVFVSSRYRMPIVPLFIILGSAGVKKIWSFLKEKEVKKLAIASVTMGCLFLICTIPGPFLEEKINYEAELYYGLGTTFDEWGRVEEAKLAYLKAIELREDYAEAHYNLANILKFQGFLEEAITHYHKSLQIKPSSVEIRTNFGAALKEKGRVDEAIKQWKKVLEQEETNPYAHFNLGLSLAEQKRHEEAKEHLQKVIQIRPDWVEGYINLALILFKMGDVDESIFYFRAALNLEPDNPEVHNNLGIALANKGQIGEATMHFYEATEIKPDYTEAYYNLGYALELQGKQEEAKEKYRRVLQINPNHEESLRRLKNLSRDWQ